MILKPRPFRKPRKGHWATKGLVGFWLLNEGSGNKVFDLSGNGNILTAYNTVPWVAGKFGSALSFDQANSEYLLTTKVPVTTTPFTVVIWAKAKVDDDQLSIFSLANTGATNDHFEIFFGGNRAGDPICIYTRDIGTPALEVVESNLTYLAGQWYQIVAVFESATYRALYIDSVFDNSGTTSITPASIDALSIGRHGDSTPGYYHEGDIDHIAIFNRSLSASEIALLYREPFCMFERDLIELWSAATLGAAPPVGMAGAMTTNSGYWGW